LAVLSIYIAFYKVIAQFFQMLGDLKHSGAELNLVLHATEDGAKVLQSIRDVLSVHPKRFSTFSTEGHYKNKILLLRAVLSSEEAHNLAISIMSLLNSSDKELLSRSESEYLDEKGNLYLRLDKQRLCEGKISLSDRDAIRIRFLSAGSRKYRGLGGIDLR
jgi:RNA binding exosome subunit